MKQAQLFLLVVSFIAQVNGACVADCNWTPQDERICGSDGATHVNQCSFECYQAKDKFLRVLAYGECPRSKPSCSIRTCNNDWTRVCGSDGQTYTNNCSLANAACMNPTANLEYVSDGACPAVTSPSTCVSKCNFHPTDLMICGTDGVTYANECSFKCYQANDKYLQLLSLGSCHAKPDDCSIQTCNDDWTQVCGADGKTYSNNCSLANAACFLKTKSLTYVKDGDCDVEEPLKVCIDKCDFKAEEDATLCGSDGVTYANACSFNCYRAADKYLHVLALGSCPKKTTSCSILQCNNDWTRVCGSDGQTYTNKCSLANVACMNPSKKLKYIADGDCPDPCVFHCSSQASDFSICASNNITYASRCYFDQARCRDPTLEFVHTGSCKAPCDTITICPRDYNPVCGSNGITFANRCIFEKEACGDRTLYIRHTGICKTKP
ncbi:hypothetical protein LEN26_002126 [Aphanomyces euteiches]|nr:hypothetical protein LEN26_002126 [Aphanomyces euteiches]